MQNDTLYNSIMKKVAEMIAEAGGGSSLPEVTADDNGDVLTVVSGAWAKAEPGSPFVFIDYDDIGNYTYADMEAYYRANKIVMIRNVYGNEFNEYFYEFFYLTRLEDPTADGENPGYVMFYSDSDWIAQTSENNKTSPLFWAN